MSTQTREIYNFSEVQAAELFDEALNKIPNSVWQVHKQISREEHQKMIFNHLGLHDVILGCPGNSFNLIYVVNKRSKMTGREIVKAGFRGANLISLCCGVLRPIASVLTKKDGKYLVNPCLTVEDSLKYNPNFQVAGFDPELGEVTGDSYDAAHQRLFDLDEKYKSMQVLVENISLARSHYRLGL